jgi:very-short-patch-repair endonuclease
MVVAQDEIGRIYTDSNESRASAVAMLWGALEARGADFQRDHQFGRYKVDFYSQASHLAVQIDAVDNQQDDIARERDLRLEALGIRVIRIPSVAVLSDLGSVVRSISAAS